MWGRQPLIVAYILLGMLLGPYVTNIVSDIQLLEQLSHIGIIFLLFLLGLDLRPEALLSTLRKSLVVVCISSLIFWAVGSLVVFSFGFNLQDAVIVGAAVMFSSTILGIKLLPTTALHHRHIGELIVGILLVQDIIAIVVLGALVQLSAGSNLHQSLIATLIFMPVLTVGAIQFVRLALLPLIARFDRIQEYIFILSIGWCLGVAVLAKQIGLSYEIGAFIAGVSLASAPISQFIALALKPLRDFFLILFFFALGASYNFAMLELIWVPAICLAVLMILAKPLVFKTLLRKQSETPHLSWDLGFRLGQISEFGILITVVAASSGALSQQAALLLQSAAIISFIVSSYIIVFSLANPMSPHNHLRKD